MSRISKRLRGKIEAALETLVALLDEVDGDVELEPEQDCCVAADDNPSPYPSALGPLYFIAAGQIDDDEPSLGAPESSIDEQRGWARGGDADREIDQQAA